MTVLEQQVPTGIWQVDPAHSSVGFSVKHMVASFRGTFDDFDATLVAGDDGEPKLIGAVRVASVQVKIPDLAAHLQGPDFFDVERNPELRFESTTFRLEGDEAVVEGDLTLRGVTGKAQAHGPVSFVEADMAGGNRIGLELETVIDRTAYGIDWNAELPKGGKALENDVTLSIHLELTPRAG